MFGQRQPNPKYSWNIPRAGKKTRVNKNAAQRFRRAGLMTLFFCLFSGLGFAFALDTTPPIGSILINSGSPYTNSYTVNLTLEAIDTGSGMGQGAWMCFSNDNLTWSSPEPYASTKAWVLSRLPGDVSGNGRLDIADALLISQHLAGLRQLTPQEQSLADVNQNGRVDIADALLIRQVLVGLRPSLPTNKDGPKTVYVKFKDAAGNWSIAYSATIILDTTPPALPIITDGGIDTSSTSQLYANWVSSDDTSGIAEYQYKITQDSPQGTIIVDWISTGILTSVTKTGLSLTLNKTYYFSVKAKSGAGLWSEVGFSDGIIIIPVLSVNVTDSEFSIGTVASDSETVSSIPLIVTNNGSGANQTYSLGVINPVGWNISQTAPGANTYVLSAAFDADGSGINWSNAEHALSTTAVACSSTKFAGDQTGASVPYNQTRKLWFQFKAPTSTTVSGEQKITITITANAGY